jgi:hypothetical protein
MKIMKSSILLLTSKTATLIMWVVTPCDTDVLDKRTASVFIAKTLASIYMPEYKHGHLHRRGNLKFRRR